MKKLIVVFICVCIMFSFSGCNKSKFENLDMMSDYLRGIWYSSSVHEYYIFKDCKSIYEFTDAHINSVVTDYFDYVVSKVSVDKFENLTVNECLKYLSDDVFSKPLSKHGKYTVYFNQGKIVFNEGKTYEYSLVVSDDGLQYMDDEGEIKYTYTKLSDSIDLTENLFGEYISEAKEKYKIPSDIFLPSVSEYIEKLKNIHPEINHWTLVDENAYTDNGSYKYYNSLLLYTDDGFTLSFNKGSLTIINEPSKISIHDKNYSSLSKLLKYAELKISNHPDALSTSEIIDMFESETEIRKGTRYFDKTIGAIRYYILQNIDDHITFVSVEIN